MSPKDLTRQHLNEKKMMQIASVSGDQPWICTVYFVADDQQNLYWLSFPLRRHSQEIEKNSKIAIAVPVEFDQPVIGIQSEGNAVSVNDSKVIKNIMKLYIDKYGQGKDFYDNFVAGKNQHVLYKFTPESFVLFDEKNFSGNPRQIWKIL
ncbi:MAG: pyridoxamine 5'-phosphate oxidase family protein [Patescibacteria group bacterium]